MVQAHLGQESRTLANLWQPAQDKLETSNAVWDKDRGWEEPVWFGAEQAIQGLGAASFMQDWESPRAASLWGHRINLESNTEKNEEKHCGLSTAPASLDQAQDHTESSTNPTVELVGHWFGHHHRTVDARIIFFVCTVSFLLFVGLFCFFSLLGLDLYVLF